MAAWNFAIMAGQIPAVRKMIFPYNNEYPTLRNVMSFFVCQQNSITGYLWAKILDPISALGWAYPTFDWVQAASLHTQQWIMYLFG